MPIYEITSDNLRKIEQASFPEVHVRERRDLQRLLRRQIDVIAANILIIAEEFGEWEDSRRRIDLLGIDKDAKLVVIELKRTEGGGRMELQALRYAAMVSTMTFEEAAEVYADYLKQDDADTDAAAAILEFLEWEEPDEEHFAQDVRIILVSADFSKELTSSVLWLNNYGLDIRCVRLRPYNDNGRTLIDVEQVIPLPEAEEYQVKLGVKKRQQRDSRTSARDLTQYDVTIGDHTVTNLAKRNAMFLVVKQLCDHGVKPERITELIPWRTRNLFLALDGHLSTEAFSNKAAKVRKAEGRRFEPRRRFCRDDQLIYSEGRTYALTNQWGHRWDQAMKNLCEAFPEMQISFHPSDSE